MDLLAQGLSWGQWLLAFLLSSVSLLLILVVLVQRGRGTGLAGAFGGAGSSAFGAKTGDVLTWITCSLAAVFFLLAVVANHAFDYSAQRGGEATAQQSATETPTPGSGTPIQVIPNADGVIEIPAGAIGPDGSSTIRVQIPPAGATEGAESVPTGAQPTEGQPPAPSPQSPLPGQPPAGEAKPTDGAAAEEGKDKPSP